MRTPYSTTTAPARFLLLGDSHAGPIGRAAADAQIAFCGGPIGAAREFNTAFFDTRDDDVVFRKAEADRLYRGFLAELGAPGLGGLTVPVVSTFGISAHTLAVSENWRIYRTRGGFPPGFWSSRLFGDIVLAMVRDALAFYRHALGLGLRLVVVMPPQRVPGMADPEVFLAAQEVVRTELLALDTELVDLRSKVTDETGFQRPAFCEPNDSIHGNLAFGRLILADLLARGL